MAATTTKLKSSDTVDPRIYHPLGKLSGAIRRYVALEGLATLFIFLASWFWIGLLVDFGLFRLTSFDWVVDAHKGFRVVALVGIVSALLALVVTRLVIRLTRDFSPPSLALILEKRFPDLLGDRLITAVELADTKKAAGYGYSEEMILETIKDARSRVDRIPVHEVFNWKRLWRQMGLMALLWIGLLAAVSTAIVLIYSMQVGRYFSKFADVSLTWAERNILLEDVPWPRNTYLEILEPTEEDKHVGRDKPELTIRVAAYKWVWADAGRHTGWRPLTWADLPKALPGETIPTLPIEAIKAVIKTAPFLTGGMFDAGSVLELPSELAHVPDDPSAWRVDRVEILLTKNEKLKAFLTSAPKGMQPILSEAGVAQIFGIFDRLAERAEEPSMSRTLRMLAVPATAVLYHRGERTKGEKASEPDKYNEFKFTLSNLQESVTYRIRGGDFSTPERKITLVPAPTIVELKGDVFSPAYHYYLPPFKDGNATAPSPQLLKSLKQELKDQNVSVAGSKSTLQMYIGSDVTLEAVTDKELKTVSMTPTIGLFPGVDSKDQADPIPLKILPGGKGFTISFTAEGKPLAELQKEARGLADPSALPASWHPVFAQAMRPLEFEVAFTDTDNVTSRRVISLQLEDDRGPEVNIAIAGLRKVGGVYLCSANANIPLTSDSNVRDDFGLHKVEYVFSYSKIEQQATPETKVSPPTSVEQRVSVPDFDKRYADAAQSKIYQLKNLLELLKQPLPSGYVKPFTTYYQFGRDETFDLMKRIPTLATGDPQAQPSYNLSVNVMATDSNVLFGPRTAQNKDPIVIKVIPYLELLGEISRDQKELAGIMDEAIKKLETCKRNLSDVSSRSTSLDAKSPAGFEDLVTRSNTIMEDMGRTNEFLIRVLVGYEKIVEEYTVNRFERYQPQLIGNTINLAVKPMRKVLEGNESYYARAEGGIVQLQNLLNQAVVPDNATTNNAQQRLQELLDQVKLIRQSMGDTLKLDRILGDLKRLVSRAEFLQKEIGEAKVIATARYFNFTFPGLPQRLTIKKGESLKLTLRFTLPKQLLNDPALKFVASPGSELSISPAEAVLKDEPNEQELALEIKAGNAVGLYKLSINPSQNKGVEIEVNVTP